MHKQNGKGLSNSPNKHNSKGISSDPGSDRSSDRSSDLRYKDETANQPHCFQQALIESIFSEKLSPASHDPATLQAINVYSNNFIENGIRALAITFPTVEGFIGEESFRMLAKKLLRHEPKISFDWADYGEGLPEFIENQAALAEYPFLGEVAALDWGIHHSQRAANKSFEPASFALMESGDTSILTFAPAPGLQIIRCWYPVLELYQLIHDPYLQSQEGLSARQALLKSITESVNAVIASEISNDSHDATIDEHDRDAHDLDAHDREAKDKQGDDAINLAPARSLLLWRAEYKAQFEYVSEGEAAVFGKVHQKSSVNDVIESVTEHDLDLVEWLTKAISQKFIFAVKPL